MKKKRKQRKQQKSSPQRPDVSCPEKPAHPVSANGDAEGLLPAAPEAVRSAELLFLCALHAYAHDRQRLRETILGIGACVAALSEDTLRPALRTVSAEVDAQLLFINPWGESRWSLLLDLDDDLDYGSFIYRPITPYLAFLLAGTDFPFTKEELIEIRDGSGVSVSEVREEMRTWSKSPGLRTEAGGKAFLEKVGGAS